MLQRVNPYVPSLTLTSVPRCHELVVARPRTPREAKRVLFLRNNDSVFKGVPLAVSAHRYRTFDKLLEEVTVALQQCQGYLPVAIWQIRRLNGVLIRSIEEFLQDDVVVALCKHERFANIDYNVKKTVVEALEQRVRLRLRFNLNSESNVYSNLRSFRPPTHCSALHPLSTEALTLTPDVTTKNNDIPIMPATLAKYFSAGKQLEHGISAAIFYATHLHSGERYVLKKVNVSTAQHLELLECELLRQLQGHPNIVNLVLTLATKNAAYLLFEAMDCDLFDLQQQKKSFDESELRFIMKCIATGLNYIHDHEIMHRDIKDSNVLVKLKMPMHIRNLKITDFGLASKCPAGFVLFQIVGTDAYMAPEIFQKTGYTYLVDCFAAGVLLYTLITNFVPNESRKLSYPLWPQHTECMSPELKHFLASLLEYDPSKRYSSKQMLEHAFLRGRE
ncbi:serine/threonine-protein kinase GD17699 [Scaptodrosophila lebanonensis]|uniref:Doublecortin-like and CAM kinase-like protein n=1 Tax=Drosophila lebanonensis TaxID=7225 RepID=A0A6J2TBK9_DROLE|nr:serine/threonine-protein kinase GD17699 [Scaptodrosophila lebanonensis]